MKLKMADGSVVVGKYLKHLGDTVGPNGEKGKWSRNLYRISYSRVAEAFVPVSGRPVREANVFVVRDATVAEMEMEGVS